MSNTRRSDRKRGEAVERANLYSSAKWQRCRAKYIKANPVCRMCGGKAAVVDHIRGHGKGWQAWFWVETNWQPLCKPCHAIKSGSEHRERWNRNQLVRGSDQGSGGQVAAIGKFVPTAPQPTERDISNRSSSRSMHLDILFAQLKAKDSSS